MQWLQHTSGVLRELLYFTLFTTVYLQLTTLLFFIIQLDSGLRASEVSKPRSSYNFLRIQTLQEWKSFKKIANCCIYLQHVSTSQAEKNQPDLRHVILSLCLTIKLKVVAFTACTGCCFCTTSTPVACICTFQKALNCINCVTAHKETLCDLLALTGYCDCTDQKLFCLRCSQRMLNMSTLKHKMVAFYLSACS